jgi:hypothetical protein
VDIRIAANHGSVYSDQSQVSLIRPITGQFILANHRVVYSLIGRIRTRAFSERYDLRKLLSCCNLHRYCVLEEVTVLRLLQALRFIGKPRHNMGLLNKIMFWKKKKNTSTPTMVDACVSTKNPWTSDAATECMDPTVMCVACTQTEETRTGGHEGIHRRFDAQRK